MRPLRNRWLASALGVVILLASVAGWMSAPEGNTRFVAPAGGAQAINRALAGLASGGGEIRLGPGLYLCDEPIIIRANRITMRGVGMATQLRLAEKANCPVVIIGDEANNPRHAVNGVLVSDLAIDGNRENQPGECWDGQCDTGERTVVRNSGIVVRRAVDVIVERIAISRCRSGGMVTEKGCRRITVRNLVCSENEFDGLACYETEDSIFENLYLHNNPAAGISTDTRFNGNVISGAILAGNGSHGIFMRDSHRNLLKGIIVRDSGRQGVFLDQVDDRVDTAASGNTFVGLTVERSKGAAVRLNSGNCKHTLFAGCQFFDNEAGLSEASPGIAEVQSSFRR